MIAHLDDRIVLSVSGPEHREFLNGLVTNDVAALTPSQPMWAGLLSAQGKYLADMMLFDGGEAGIFIDVHISRAEELLKKLKLYRLRRPIAIAPSSLRVFAGWKERELPKPADPRHPALGQRWLAAGGSVNASGGDWHRHRLHVGIPDTPDFEVDKTMWLETNAAELNGVSFGKGCYVGQENTARMNWRQKVSKRLLPVTMVAGPVNDHEVHADGKRVGMLGSHAEMADGSWRGMALIRVEEAHKPLLIDGIEAEVDWPAWLQGSEA